MIDFQPFIENGLLGTIIAWFMFRMEKVINNNTEVLYGVKEKLNKR